MGWGDTFIPVVPPDTVGLSSLWRKNEDTNLFKFLQNKSNNSGILLFLLGKGTATQEEWEERILLLSSDIMSETLLGIRLDGEAFLNWRFEVLKKTK